MVPSSLAMSSSRDGRACDSLDTLRVNNLALHETSLELERFVLLGERRQGLGGSNRVLASKTRTPWDQRGKLAMLGKSELTHGDLRERVLVNRQLSTSFAQLPAKLLQLFDAQATVVGEQNRLRSQRTCL